MQLPRDNHLKTAHDPRDERIAGWLPQLIVIAALILSPPDTQALAQNGQNGQGGGIGGGGQGQGQGNGQFGGIAISPDGVVSAAGGQRINPKLEQRRLKAVAASNLSASMAQPGAMRHVSLRRLESAIEEHLKSGSEIPASIKHLAGLTQIEYVFAIPETGDVLIAGPAEGFAAMQNGRVVGVETGRPVLVLDDLLVMARLPDLGVTLGCSFDPEPQRLVAANNWNKANSSPASRSVATRRFYEMAQVLGNWNVTVFGLPENSHAAVTTVEADFQLKQLALGLKKPAVRGFKSHLMLAKPAENMMRRWWFAPLYDPIERSNDGNSFRLAGPRLQLMTQDELVDAQGNRTDAAFREVSTEKYTLQFNRHLPALCQQIPAFAATQNLFDLAVVVALIRKHRLAEKSGWTPSLLLDAERLPILKYNVPTEVPSLVNVRPLGTRLILGLIGGGVTVVPNRIVGRTIEMQPGRRSATTKVQDDSNWWWDVE